MNDATRAAREIYKLIAPHLNNIGDTCCTLKNTPAEPAAKDIMKQVGYIFSLLEDCNNG